MQASSQECRNGEDTQSRSFQLPTTLKCPFRMPEDVPVCSCNNPNHPSDAWRWCASPFLLHLCLICHYRWASFQNFKSLPVKNRKSGKCNVKFGPKLLIRLKIWSYWKVTEAEMATGCYLYLKYQHCIRIYWGTTCFPSLVCRCFFFLQSIKIVFEERKQMVAVIVALSQGGKK